jgi:poly-gamma-glutamate capsule biosynthesis protein CapA/YwtB (metallophosphatase superfamily)
MAIKVLITGDFCPTNRIGKYIQDGCYEQIFNDFLPHIKNADLAITNLECPLTSHDTPIQKSGPAIKCAPEAIEALKFAGFGLATMANNHVLDYGEEGVKSTLNACENAGIATVGVGLNAATAKKVFYTKIQDKTIAVYNVAENEFGNTYGNEAGGNALDPVSNFYDIIEARKHCDYLFVIAHGGREHYQLPSPRVQKLYRFFIDSGADAVIAHHTHCYSGYEVYKGKNIFYSLGNFIFDYKKKYQKGLWTEGYAVQITLANDGIVYDLLPYYQGRESDPTVRLFDKDEKLKFDEKISELNKTIADEQLLAAAWKAYLKTQEISYKGSLYIQNKYVRELIRRSILPPVFMHSKEHSLILLNLLRCETHREILIDVLTDKFKD